MYSKNGLKISIRCYSLFGPNTRGSMEDSFPRSRFCNDLRQLSANNHMTLIHRLSANYPYRCTSLHYKQQSSIADKGDQLIQYQFLGKHRLLLGPENTNRFAHYFEYEEQSPLLGSAELVSNMGDAVATLESQHHQTDMYPRYKRRTRPFPTRINSPPS